MPLGVVANAMAPAVALGYAIGRIGCQLAGDGDYGKVSGLPWAMGYPHGTVPTPPGVKVQPTPIYETLTMTLVAYILWRLATRYEKSGWWTFGWFLVLSGVERFIVEFVRRNTVWFWGLTQPQWVAIGSVIVGTALVRWYGKRPAERVAPEPRAARRRRRAPDRRSGAGDLPAAVQVDHGRAGGHHQQGAGRRFQQLTDHRAVTVREAAAPRQQDEVHVVLRRPPAGWRAPPRPRARSRGAARPWCTARSAC